MADTEQDRAEAQRRVVEALARHTSYLYRSASETNNRIMKIIDDAGKSLASELSDRLDNLTPGEFQALIRHKPGSRTDRLPTRVQGVVKYIDQWASALGEEITARFNQDGEELAGHEVEYTKEMMASVLTETAAVSITASEAYRSALDQPVLGQFVEDMLSGISEDTRQRVYARIREGVGQGETNQQIVRSLRGTQALNYKDGTLQATRNAAERVVRTGRNHISNVAYVDTYAALGVEYVVWTSTLDGRTCLVAGSLIDTPQGKRPIESLKAGDEVLGGSGCVKRIAATRKAMSKKLCRVKLSNGEKVTCTQDHMFWTTRGWVEAKELMTGDSLPDRL